MPLLGTWLSQQLCLSDRVFVCPSASPEAKGIIALMATRKKTLLGARIPRVGLAPTKTPAKKRATKKTSKKAAKKRTTVKRAATARERVDQTIAAITERMQRVDTEYYEIGQAILGLDQPDIWRDTFGERSFAAFIEEHLMPYSTARRLLVIAREYTKSVAAQIGLERGYQLDRLADNDPDIKRSPQQMWISNVPLGPTGQKKKVRTLSATEIANLVQLALMKTGRTRKSTPSKQMKQSAKKYKKSFPYKTRVRFDLKKKDVVIRVSIEDFVKHY